MIEPGEGEPVITPEKWLTKMCGGLSGEYQAAILTFWGSPIDLVEGMLSDAHEVRLKGVPTLRAVGGEFRGVRVLATHLYPGAPAATIALELLIALGIRKFLAYGGAGSITHKLRIGDVLIPTWGVREEGTSYHYVPEGHVPKPSQRLARRLREAMSNTLALRGSRVVEGGVWSTDAIFRQTEDKVREYAGKGVLGVDMESTALMTVAEYRGVELAVALVITDKLTPPEWRTPSKGEWGRIENVEVSVLNAMLGVLHSQR